MRKKINEISIYEVFMCTFVVFAHSLSECVNLYPNDSFMYALSFFASRCLSVAVPAFLFSSGIKFMNKYKNEKFTYSEFILDRIYKIFIPYILFVCIYYFYFIFRQSIVEFDLKELFKYIFSGKLSAQFYFIIVIMQFYILAPLWLVFCRKIHPFIGILIALLITFFSHFTFLNYNLNSSLCFTYCLYWVTGCYIGVNFSKGIEYVRKIKRPLIMLGVIFTLTYSTIAYMWSVRENTPLTNEVIEMTRIIFCFFAALMYLSVMPSHSKKIIDIISPATYYIYLIHCLVIFEVDYVMNLIGIVSIEQRFLIRISLAYTLSVLISVIYVYTKKLITKT